MRFGRHGGGPHRLEREFAAWERERVASKTDDDLAATDEPADEPRVPSDHGGGEEGDH